MTNEPTNAEILSAIKNLSASVDYRFLNADKKHDDVLESISRLSANVDRRFADADKKHDDVLEAMSAFSANVDERLDRLEDDVSGLTADVSSLKTDVTRIKATMVTKDYLDEKMSDLRGDLVVLVRKEDSKVTALVHELTDLNVLPENSAKRILSMEPFAR